MRSFLHSSAICLLLATAACAGSSGAGGTEPESGPTIRIENRSSSDMDIYLRPALSRAIRLGFVPASDSASFALSRALLAGSTSFRIEARPVRGAGGPALSDQFTVGRGEEIYWSIPPQ